MKTKLITAALAAAFTITSAYAQKYKADVPKSVTTPDSVETRIGTLKFKDGLPDAETVTKVYDNLDFARGIETFMTGMPAASVQALKKGFAGVGLHPNGMIAITEQRADARSVFLTPNTSVIYLWGFADVTDGPVVVEAPPASLGLVNDAYFRFLTDMGVFGPDEGKGGKYLFVPKDYQGTLPTSGYYIVRTPSRNNLVIIRAFIQNNDVPGTVAANKAKTRIYPLAAAASPPEQKFLNISGLKFNTVHANNFEFYEELNEVVQYEPDTLFDPDTVGLFASIGIKKGKPFAPDARMKAILTDAVAVGNATARTINFAARDPRQKFFPDRQWLTGFLGGYSFSDGGERILDGRTLFHYYATGITPAMVPKGPGIGSAYAFTARDSRGEWLDGGKTYKVTLPGPIPAVRFWSLTVYDNQTRSLLETDQVTAGIDSLGTTMKMNPDGGATIYFGPTAPTGQENNWIQTMPGKTWDVCLRLYGPKQEWLDLKWKPGDVELVN